MSAKNWVLTDVTKDIHVDDIAIGPREVGGSAQGYLVAKHTLRGGLSDGVDVIHVDNGKFSFVVVPTRGMGLWKSWLQDWEIGWHSPVRGPVHPQFVPLTEPSGLGWLDGFDELLVRCGLESNGAPDFDEQGRLRYGLHGRIANRPAHRVEVNVNGDAGEITVTGVTEESRFHFSNLRMTTTLKTRIGEPGVQITDEIENYGGVEADIQMLYHINFGRPLLQGGSRLVAPARTVVPSTEHAADAVNQWDTYSEGTPGFAEQVYFMDLAAGADNLTRVMLAGPGGARGVSLLINKSKLPCFTLWKNTGALADGYVTGLEPATNFPNPRSYEAGQERVVKLPPRGKITFDLGLEVHATPEEVKRAEQEIGKLQGGTEPRIFDKPQPGWCA